MPLLAFCPETLHKLEVAGGYYDRTLLAQSTDKKLKSYTVGIALECLKD